VSNRVDFRHNSCLGIIPSTKITSLCPHGNENVQKCKALYPVEELFRCASTNMNSTLSVPKQVHTSLSREPNTFKFD
jgi:hypothetical protein